MKEFEMREWVEKKEDRLEIILHELPEILLETAEKIADRVFVYREIRGICLKISILMEIRGLSLKETEPEIIEQLVKEVIEMTPIETTRRES